MPAGDGWQCVTGSGRVRYVGDTLGQLVRPASPRSSIGRGVAPIWLPPGAFPSTPQKLEAMNRMAWKMAAPSYEPYRPWNTDMKICTPGGRADKGGGVRAEAEAGQRVRAGATWAVWSGHPACVVAVNRAAAGRSPTCCVPAMPSAGVWMQKVREMRKAQPHTNEPAAVAAVTRAWAHQHGATCPPLKCCYHAAGPASCAMLVWRQLSAGLSYPGMQRQSPQSFTAHTTGSPMIAVTRPTGPATAAFFVSSAMWADES